MTRQTRRLLEKQGALNEDGTPAPRSGAPANKPAPAAPSEDRGNVIQRLRRFIDEVQAEMKKVVWPTRPDVTRYFLVVVALLVVLTSLIFGLDFLFSKLSMNLFNI